MLLSNRKILDLENEFYLSFINLMNFMIIRTKTLNKRLMRGNQGWTQLHLRVCTYTPWIFAICTKNACFIAICTLWDFSFAPQTKSD